MELPGSSNKGPWEATALCSNCGKTYKAKSKIGAKESLDKAWEKVKNCPCHKR